MTMECRGDAALSKGKPRSAKACGDFTNIDPVHAANMRIPDLKSRLLFARGQHEDF